MKMLKKAGAIAIAGAMVMSLGTISALAEGEALTLGAIEYTPATAENTIATFKVPYTAAAGVNQVTLLAELGATEGVFANAIAYETTAYIDQEAADTYFEFKIDDSRLQLAEGQEKLFLNVKVGGTGVATPATKSLDITPKSAEPEAPITNTMVSGAVDATITDAYGTTGAVISRLDITELVANGKIDLTKQTVKIGGVEAKYTLYNNAYKVVYVGAAITADTVVEVVDSETGMARLYYGDTNGSSTAETPDDITALDATPVINHVLKTGMISDNYALMVADTNADGNVSALDATPIINIVLRTASSVPATTK